MTKPVRPPKAGPKRLTLTRWPLLASASFLLLTLFILDLVTPVGVAAWLLYLAVVLLCLTAPGRWPVLLAATVCTILTIAGLYLSPPNRSASSAAINRGLAGVTFWLAAIGGLAVRRSVSLRVTNERLLAEIEDRKKAESRVREQAGLLDIAHDAISVWDLNDRILYWNRGAERLYGWTAAEVRGRCAIDLLLRVQEKELAAARSTLYERGEWTGEARHATKDGRDILVETRWTLVRDEAGRPRSKLVVNTDVTERRRLETQVLRTQRLESIGVLAGGIAHDFNNLLTPMLMAVKLLREDRPPAERERLLAALQSGAERGAELVRKLLSFAGGGGGERGPVAVPAVVREVQGIVSHTFPKSIRLDLRLQPGLRQILADSTQLSQVLMNLLVNARDAMPGGGTLVVAARNTPVGPAEAAQHPDAAPGDYVRLDVADTGCGIPHEVIDRIFDPFFTTKKAGRGTGLGLSTVLGIVRSHGGFVTVASIPGAGTRFSVFWPVAVGVPSDAPTSAPTTNTRPVGDGETVLVVDDEAPILQTARAALETGGYQVVTARDGRAALDAYRAANGRVGAVVLDVMMPGMDGSATLSGLHKLQPDCRVLLTSGLRLPPPLVAAVRDGRARFLQKPYTADQLLAAVSGLMPVSA